MFLLAALVHSSHLGCSNLLVGAKASGTGSPQIAYTSDAGFQYVCPRLSFSPIRLQNYLQHRHPPLFWCVDMAVPATTLLEGTLLARCGQSTMKILVLTLVSNINTLMNAFNCKT